MSLIRNGRRILGAAMLLAVMGVGTTPALGAADGPITGPRRAMLALTNRDRAEHGRPQLGFAGALGAYARHHSRVMATKGHLFHSTEAQLQRALEGYEWTLGGENVGVGSSLESLQAAFMASPTHRAIILRRSFEHAAVGIVRRDGRIWITVIFYG